MLVIPSVWMGPLCLRYSMPHTHDLLCMFALLTLSVIISMIHLSIFPKSDPLALFVKRIIIGCSINDPFVIGLTSIFHLLKTNWYLYGAITVPFMSAMAPQITSVLIVCSTVCSGTDQRKHQSSASHPKQYRPRFMTWYGNTVHDGS